MVGVLLVERPAEQVQRQLVADHCGLWVVAFTFVTHEGVLGVELVPCEFDVFGIAELFVHFCTARGWDVRVLLAPDH